MLKITSAQRAVLGRPFVDEFVDRMVVQLGACFPRPCRALGPDLLRAAIHRGIGRAQAHAFVSERDLCLYLGLMLTFGEDFDRALPWARAVLADPTLAEPRARIDRLADEGEAHEPDPNAPAPNTPSCIDGGR